MTLETSQSRLPSGADGRGETCERGGCLESHSLTPPAENRLLPTELRREALALQKSIEFDDQGAEGECQVPRGNEQNRESSSDPDPVAHSQLLANRGWDRIHAQPG
uniref:Uncharacterized protein n=1 Tax=Chrysemys picta bellii TaxID=8478 RepID=A0A8C3F4S4_CHRPI